MPPIFSTRPKHTGEDIHAIIEEAGNLGYPTRYWWLSQAMDIQGCPDRLIICVHHPTNDENAGMDLYETLKNLQVSYDELNAAALEEYMCLGRRVARAGDIRKADGTSMFSV